MQRIVAGVDPRQHAGERVEVHRFFETVADRLRHQRVIRDLAIAGNVLEAGGGVGKHRRHQVVGEHPLQLRRHLLAAAAARHGERDRRVPAPPGLKDRRVEKRLHQHVARRRRMQIAEDVGERKRMLRAERQQQRVFGRRGLQLEVELTAEPLAQREAPRLVDAAAERRVQHELHAAGLVEEPLEDQGVLRRQRAQRGVRIGEIRDRLFRGGRRDTGFVDEPVDWQAKACATTRDAPIAASGVAQGCSPACNRTSTSARKSLTARDSSSLRAGASPSQNGIVGGAPWRRRRGPRRSPTWRICHDALPS